MAVHDICSAIGPSDDIIPDIVSTSPTRTLQITQRQLLQESAVCNKLLGFLADVEPINKDYVVGLLASGSGRTMRIARVIARSIILDKRTVTSVSPINQCRDCLLTKYSFRLVTPTCLPCSPW